MNIRKKFFSILGVLALTTSMSAGIAAAQEAEPAGDSIGLTFVVSCGANNAGSGTSSATIGRSDGGTEAIAFASYDPATNTEGAVSTEENAFRVNISLYCPTATWAVTANITDFTDSTVEPALAIPGDAFQLTSTGQWTTDGTTPAVNVNEPAEAVTFSGTNGSYSSTALAQASGATTDSTMSMDFTGHLVGLDELNIEDGNYSTEVTVTFNPSGL